MATSNTSLCDQALGRIGANRIPDGENIETSLTLEAIQCRLHFEPTRDALIRSHRWRFAAARSELTQDSTDPDFEYDNQFVLPTDFLALRSIFGDNLSPSENTQFTFAIEGQRLLTDESTVPMRYTKKVTDPTEFDPLFVEVLVLLLADKFIGPLAGGDDRIQKKIDRALEKLMPKVRAMDRQEINQAGRANQRPWVEAHLHGGSFRIDRTPI